MELIGLYLIAAGLLCVAGVAKAVRPDDTARAVAALVPGTPPLRLVRWTVRLGALAEAALGAVAVLFPRPLIAALVALSYLAFFGFVAYARRRGGPLATCGCFGRPDTPPTALHLFLDLVLATAAAVVATGSRGGETLWNQLAQQPGAGLPLLFVSGVGLWLAALALASLASLTAAQRLVRTTPAHAQPS
jgi:hypothetical protein